MFGNFSTIAQLAGGIAGSVSGADAPSLDELASYSGIAAAPEATAQAVRQVSNLEVMLMGMGIVFCGLICIVLICKLVGLFFIKSRGKEAVSSAPAVQNAAPAAIANRQEMVAAIAAAIAEELGEDISAIRIRSIRPL